MTSIYGEIDSFGSISAEIMHNQALLTASAYQLQELENAVACYQNDSGDQNKADLVNEALRSVNPVAGIVDQVVANLIELNRKVQQLDKLTVQNHLEGQNTTMGEGGD